MFERFTDAGRRSIVLAQESARDLGHRSITVVHLLLGVTRVLQETGDDLLDARGVTPEQLHRAVAEVLPAEPADQASEGQHVPFSGGAKKALEMSLREALERGHNEIQPRHLLLGVLNTPDDDLDAVLAAVGLSAGSLRADVDRGMPAATGPARLGSWEGRRRLERIEAMLAEVLARLERIERRLDGS